MAGNPDFIDLTEDFIDLTQEMIYLKHSKGLPIPKGHGFPEIRKRLCARIAELRAQIPNDEKRIKRELAAMQKLAQDTNSKKELYPPLSNEWRDTVSKAIRQLISRSNNVGKAAKVLEKDNFYRKIRADRDAAQRRVEIGMAKAREIMKLMKDLSELGVNE